MDKNIKLKNAGLRRVSLWLRAPVQICVFASCFISVIAHAHAQEQADPISVMMRIDDRVVTSLDLWNHFRTVSFLGRTPDDRQTYSQFEDQIRKSLVQKIFQEEITKDTIQAVTENEVDKYIEEILKANNSSLEAYSEDLKNRGLSESILHDHFRLQLGWNRFILQNFGAVLQPTAEEIKARQNDFITQADERRYVYREILIGTGGSQESVDRITALINQGGDLANLARSFSESASAFNGGLIGPLTESELSKPVYDSLQSMTPGRGYAIVPVARGTLIISLVRTIDPQIIGSAWTYSYFRIRQDDQSTDNSDQLSARLKSCRVTKILEKRLGLSLELVENAILQDIPVDERNIIKDLEVSEVSSFFSKSDGETYLYQLCTKERVYQGIFNRQQIGRQILEYRLGQAGKKILEEKERSSFIQTVK